MSQFCSFFAFFSSFPANLFLGVSGLVFGLFRGGANFDLLAGFGVSGACGFYLLYGAKIGAGCFVIWAGFVCPCQPVGLSGAGRVSMAPSSQASPWLQPSNKFFEQVSKNFIRTNFRNTCSSGFLALAGRISNRI
jgi:hypothetical protein